MIIAYGSCGWEFCNVFGVDFGLLGFWVGFELWLVRGVCFYWLVMVGLFWFWVVRVVVPLGYIVL